ncbi:uncharacterized protein LOC101850633 [Aplysia californica]|uniref:Voltage-gated hydrogen channel 1 n=1 Tax=Aplysia californica TaxID=6500 RepID=A0ABM1VPF6_APLCA|nr:uncharacterized protein LOC101850633 [Aplysia californica]XP_005093107.1 uncharacterized protein LOC101850633 [Aplysia californica]XP_035824298.1 uncharacterized protein LOC101850633 [Aplysia californica]
MRMSRSIEYPSEKNGEPSCIEAEQRSGETKMLKSEQSQDEAETSDWSENEDSHSGKLDANSCKGKLAAFLKTNLVQYSIIALVILDCLIIVMELLIDMNIIVFPEDDPHHPPGEGSSHHPVAFASRSSNLTGDNHTVYPAHHIHTHHDNSSNLTMYGNDSAHAAPVHHHTNKEKAEHVLHALSLTILSIFMVEVCVKIYVEGKHMLKQKAEVFDAIVVIVSFTLDITFSFVSVSKAASEAAGLMVILRLWRVTRIINGVIMSVKLDANKKMEVHKKARRKLERENKRLQAKIERLEREVATLKQKMATSSTPQMSFEMQSGLSVERSPSGEMRENSAQV